MDENCAYICAFICLVAIYYWYKYCLRIYNRFKVLPQLMIIINSSCFFRVYKQIHKVQFAWQESEEGPRIANDVNAHADDTMVMLYRCDILMLFLYFIDH
jgi:hypothetical protein